MYIQPSYMEDNRKIVTTSTGYTPRPLQHDLHNNLSRFNVLVCHRRFGKTVFAVNEMIDQAQRNRLRTPQYAYIAPTYKIAMRVAWQYFVDYSRNIPGVRVNKTEATVYIDRKYHRDFTTGLEDPDFIKIMMIGADDPDALRGMYLDGCILDEYAQCDPIVWGEIVRPALADRGKIAREAGIRDHAQPWCIFIGTPKGQNHFYFRYKKAQEAEAFVRLYERKHDIDYQISLYKALEDDLGITNDLPRVELEKLLKRLPESDAEEYRQWREYVVSLNWFTVLHKASETGIIGQSEYDEMVRDLDPESVQQELECSFTAAIRGSYYGHLINEARRDGRVTRVPYDSRYPVDTFWDLGISDKMCIWFRQRVHGMFRYIDYYEDNGKGIEHYVKILRERPYAYGRHVWPHDGANKEFSGKKRYQTARDHGLVVELQKRIRDKAEHIQASRQRIGISWFDEEHCDRGLECLYNYQKEWDSKLMMFKDKPKHDWSSNGADAFAISAMDDRISVFESKRGTLLPKVADSDYNEI